MSRTLLVTLGCALAAVAGGAGAPDTLKFSHKAHIVDVGAACVDCHESAAGRAGAGAPRSVTEASCKKCHDNNAASFECATCHTNEKAARAARPAKRNVRFSHKAHLAKGADCTPCHAGLDKADKATEASFPTMETCLACHNNRTARAVCNLCHADLASIKPATHTIRWLARGGHGYDARTSRAECAQCHQDPWCSQCHMGNTATRIHTPGYAFEHGLDVRRNEANCTVCHDTRNACGRCHEGKR